jgi:hypothetical protein
LIFLGAKEIVYLSSDYYIIDGDQAPTSKKGRLPACSKSSELTSKSAEPTAAYPESARPTSQYARPTAPASAKVGLADFQSAKPTFLVPATINVPLDDSAPIVDHSLKMKSNIIQIKRRALLQHDRQGKKYKYFTQISIWSYYFNFYIY